MQMYMIAKDDALKPHKVNTMVFDITSVDE